jgi:opacity protein-like surface antigen
LRKTAAGTNQPISQKGQNGAHSKSGLISPTTRQMTEQTILKGASMIRRFWFLVILILVSAPAAFAQRDYHRWEVAGTFVYAKQEPNSGEQTSVEGTDSFSFQPCTPDGADVLGHDLQGIFCLRRGFKGFNGSATYNFKKYVGVQGDITWLEKNDITVDDFGEHVDTNRFKDHTFEVMGGVQIKNNDTAKRFKPFFHVLAGFARQTSRDVQTSTGPFNFTLNDSVTSFAMKIGGGADLRLGKRIDLRLIEINYNPIFAGGRHVPGNADFDLTLAGKRADNLTIGVGIVIH